MKKIKIIIQLFFILTTFASASTDQKAEALVEGKQKMDMTYKEMMQIMGRSASMIYEGILLQNSQMVKDGALAISGHKAPKHKPWLIVEKSKQKAFKEMLLIYDQELHKGADAILETVTQKDWHKTNQAFSSLTENCITCHESWRDQVIKRDFKKVYMPLKEREDHDHLDEFKPIKQRLHTIEQERP